MLCTLSELFGERNRVLVGRLSNNVFAYCSKINSIFGRFHIHCVASAVCDFFSLSGNFALIRFSSVSLFFGADTFFHLFGNVMLVLHHSVFNTIVANNPISSDEFSLGNSFRLWRTSGLAG